MTTATKTRAMNINVARDVVVEEMLAFKIWLRYVHDHRSALRSYAMQQLKETRADWETFCQRHFDLVNKLRSIVLTPIDLVGFAPRIWQLNEWVSTLEPDAGLPERLLQALDRCFEKGKSQNLPSWS